MSKWLFQKTKSALTSEAPSTSKPPPKIGPTAANTGGNGHRRQDLNTGIEPVAVQEEMNDIQVGQPNLT